MTEDTNAVRIPYSVLRHLSLLAPGVRGYTVEYDGALYIPLLHADHPGHGAVGRYLDGLPRDRSVRVPCVISSRLRGMLLRRGFVCRAEYAPELDTWVEVWCREPAAISETRVEQ